MPKAREGDYSLSHKGGLGGLPRDFFGILSASICVFNGVVCVWDRNLVVFGHNLLLEKIFYCRMRNQMLDKIVFRQSQVILLFSSACFFDIISSMYPQILAKYF